MKIIKEILYQLSIWVTRDIISYPMNIIGSVKRVNVIWYYLTAKKFQFVIALKWVFAHLLTFLVKMRGASYIFYIVNTNNSQKATTLFSDYNKLIQDGYVVGDSSGLLCMRRLEFSTKCFGPWLEQACLWNPIRAGSNW